MGKRARRRVREHQSAVDQRRVAAELALAGPADGPPLEDLRRLAERRVIIDRRIEDLVDQLVAAGVGWVVVGQALGVTRQAARQAFLRRSRAVP